MNELNQIKAIVIDTNDPNKKGRVKVRLIPYMNDVKEADLPWYDPLTCGNTSQVIYDPLKEGTIVRVLSSDSYRNGYILSSDFIEGFFDFDSVKSSLDSISELSDTSYENIRFYLMENNNIQFYNRSTGEHGFFHSSGGYYLFDSNNNLVLNSSSEIILQGGGDFAVRFSVLETAYNQLKTDFDNLVNLFNLHTHVYAPGPGSPIPTAPPPTPGTPSTGNISGAKVDDVRMPS